MPSSTVKEYFQILEDTLLGEFLWPYDRSERKMARPKFYFFDCGVIRALQNRLNDPPTPSEKGILFESWMIRELIRIRDYEEKEHEFGLWRKGRYEVDLLILKSGKPILALEFKSGKTDIDSSAFNAFKAEFPNVPLWVVSMTDVRYRKLELGVEIHPWKKVVEDYRALK